MYTITTKRTCTGGQVLLIQKDGKLWCLPACPLRRVVRSDRWSTPQDLSVSGPPWPVSYPPPPGSEDVWPRVYRGPVPGP